MTRYRKKPIEVEARGPLTSDNSAEIAAWSGAAESPDVGPTDSPTVYSGELIIPTLEGPMTARLGDYVIQGVHGEFYPCKPDVFEATYERVSA